MKFITGVATFAASQLQITNLRVRGPEFKTFNEKLITQIKDSKNEMTLKAKFVLSFLILGVSVIGYSAFGSKKKLKI